LVNKIGKGFSWQVKILPFFKTCQQNWLVFLVASWGIGKVFIQKNLILKS